MYSMFGREVENIALQARKLYRSENPGETILINNTVIWYSKMEDYVAIIGSPQLMTT